MQLRNQSRLKNILQRIKNYNSQTITKRTLKRCTSGRWKLNKEKLEYKKKWYAKELTKMWADFSM